MSESRIRVRVYIPHHARCRIEERGGDVSTIASAARQAARRVVPRLQRPRRLAVDCKAVPEVLSVVEFSPARKGTSPKAVVKTVLPFDAPSLASMEVVHV
jgi:hypothetical protein